MDGATAALKKKLDRLPKEAAEILVALDRGDGTISGVPHYSLIEARAHELAQRLSREIQARQRENLVLGRTETAPSPKCRVRGELDLKTRTVTSIDGPVAVQELEGYCPDCRRTFYPPTERRLGLMPAN